jgi:small-conductance mechanosensitive channel
VKDLISGFFILLYDQIRVGDVVQIAGKGGLVENINLKMVRLRDLAGNVYFVPNGEIGVVTNMTKEYSMFVFDVGVAYREDVDEVMEVLKKIDEELRADPKFASDILAPLEILGVDQFADSAVVIKARTKTLPIKQWGVAREFNRRMKKRFDELNIEIPFPHVTLYMGEGKKGGAPPAFVKLEGAGAAGSP